MNHSEVRAALDNGTAEKEGPAPDTFNRKNILQPSGFNKMPVGQLKKIFEMLDADGSGAIEEEELKLFTANFTEPANNS